jgi:hypothetical protein
VYNLVLSGAQPLDFTQIGSGGGLLPAPVTRTELRVGPGERADIVIGFAPYQSGEMLHLRDMNSNTDVLQFRVTTDNATDNSVVPATLRSLPDIGEPTVTRAFNFGKTTNHWTINGLLSDPDRVDFSPVLGTTERWVISNNGGAVHTFHVHDVEAQCLSRNSGPCLPQEVFDDTFFLGPNETLELKMRFTDFKGRYVFHCHVLEHEQDGMMMQFQVVPPNDPDGDGWTTDAETQIGTNPLDSCGNDGWPADLLPGGFAPNTLNIQDLGSFVAPVRRLNTSQGDPGFDKRWDLVPGSTFGETINIVDMATLFSGATAYPAMFDGQRAFGRTCPAAP